MIPTTSRSSYGNACAASIADVELSHHQSPEQRDPTAAGAGVRDPANTDHRVRRIHHFLTTVGGAGERGERLPSAWPRVGQHRLREAVRALRGTRGRGCREPACRSANIPRGSRGAPSRAPARALGFRTFAHSRRPRDRRDRGRRAGVVERSPTATNVVGETRLAWR